jgi:hypothetical protein
MIDKRRCNFGLVLHRHDAIVLTGVNLVWVIYMTVRVLYLLIPACVST